MSHFDILSAACPGAFDENEKLPSWRAVPEDFDRFLRDRTIGNETPYVIRQLHHMTDYAGGTVVRVSTNTLAKKLGINPSNLRRVQRDGCFLYLVKFTPGIMRVAGAPGIPAEYDLAPLWQEYRTWRRRP